MYITIDSFYTVNEFNNIIQTAENNGLDLENNIFISIKQPYNWFIKIPDDIKPYFINFRIASLREEKNLASRLSFYKTEDYYNLLRRETDKPANFSKFILNDSFSKAMTEENVILFRYKNIEELMRITKEIECTVYLLNYKRWKTALCFNKHILGELDDSMILYKNLGGKQLRKPGELEAHFNYKIFVKEKLSDKPIISTKILNGKKILSKKTI